MPESTPPLEARLTALELDLWNALRERPGVDLTRRALRRRVWGAEEGVDLRAVDSAVRRLRKKLGPSGRIVSTRGVGYRYAGPVVERAAEVAGGLRVATGRIDPVARRFVPRSGAPIDLGPSACGVVSSLAEGVPRSRARVAAEVWGPGDHLGALSVCVSRLRKQLEQRADEPRVLLSLPGGRLMLGVRPAIAEGLGAEARYVEPPERTAARQALDRGRCLVLTGPPGIGKSHLARRVVRGMQDDGVVDEVALADLSLVFDGASLREAVAAALHLPPADLPAAARSLPPTVLIADGFDDLGASGRLLEELLESAPDLRLVVTACAAPQLSGAHVVRLAALDPERAEALYRLLAPGAASDAEATELVRRLDGVPLAIEFAAARARDLSPAQLLERWDEGLDLWVRASPSSRSHHRTLRSSLDGCWARLTSDARRALAWMSTFEGPTTVERARLLLEGSCDALDALTAAALVERPDDQTVRLLQVVRAYAAERLCMSGEQDTARRRHAALHLAEAGRLTRLPEDIGPLRALASFADDLRAIVRRVDGADRSLAALALGLHHEAQGRAEAADAVYRAHMGGATRQHLWRMVCGRARWAGLRGDRDHAVDLLREAVELARPLDARSLGTAQLQLCSMLLMARRLDEATACGKEAARTFASVEGHRNDLANVRGILARVEARRGRTSVAIALLDEVAAMEDAGDISVVVQARVGLRLEAGRLDEAAEVLEVERRRVTSMQPVHDAQCRAVAAQLRMLRGEHRGIDAELEEVETVLGEMGQRVWSQMAALNRVQLATRRGDIETAERLLHRPVPWRLEWHAPIAASVYALAGKPRKGSEVLAPLLARMPSTNPRQDAGWAALDAALALPLGRLDHAVACIDRVEGRRDELTGADAERMDVLLLLARALVAQARDEGGQEALAAARRIRSSDGYRLVHTGHIAYTLHALLRGAVEGASAG